MARERLARELPGARRRRGSMRLLLLAVAATAVLAIAGTASTAAPPARAALLGATWAGGGELVLLDPLSLRPVLRSGVRLAGGWSTARSADGSLVAVTTGTTLRVLDARTLRVLRSRRVENRAGDGAWPERSRLITLPSAHQRGDAVVLDPLTGSVVARRALPGRVLASSAARGGAAVLLAPANRIGVLRLAIVTGDGSVHSVRLPGLRGGLDPARPGRPGSFAQPGLAVDPGGRRAVVVTALALVEVSLDTLDVRPRPLAVRRPASAQKTVVGWSRHAAWVSGTRLAITGSSYATASSRGRLEQIPAGLTLVDTARWHAQPVEPGVSEVAVVGRTIVAAGVRCGGGSDACQGIGLRGYAPSGRLRFQLFGTEVLAGIQVAGGRVYLSDCNSFCYRVVDPVSGRLVADVRTTRQTVLAR